MRNSKLLSLIEAANAEPIDETPITPEAPPAAEGKATMETRLVEALIESLERGVSPWQQPWVGGGKHRNLVSGHVFSGQNPGWLHFWAQVCGYQLPLWLTFAQGKSKGWFPIKGSKAASIVQPVPVRYERKDDNGTVVRGSDGEPEVVSFTTFRVTPIFNAGQMTGDGLEAAIEAATIAAEEDRTGEIISGVEAIEPWQGYITHGGDRACYSPSQDRIYLPEPRQFLRPEGYYATALHELAHLSGSSNRLDREGLRGAINFGSDTYAREELVAELASFLMCYRLEIDSKVEGHASYLASWIKCLREDPKLLMKSMLEASKAADYVLDGENAKSKAE